MKFLFASDSFKGTLSSEKIAELLTKTAKEHFPDCQTASIPVADGGEGTVDAVVKALKGDYRFVKVKDPLMNEITAGYGIFGEGKAILEMAAASGLPLVPMEKRNPFHTTTFGTGQLITDALENGITDISIAIGGSATNDGGMGAMIALGAKFLDMYGNELEGKGENLGKVCKIDCSQMNPLIKKATFTIMCDVTNPLIGKDGATYTFGMQKGADEEQLKLLENGMVSYAKVLNETFGFDIANTQGAGAAGGLGAALLGFLNGKMKSGIDTVLDLIGFDKLLEKIDFVVTGEGRMDWQSAFGKVPAGIGQRCKKMNIPAVAIVGGMGKGAEKIFDFGINSIFTTINGAMDISEAMERSEELYLSAADRMFRMLKLSIEKK